MIDTLAYRNTESPSQNTLYIRLIFAEEGGTDVVSY